MKKINKKRKFSQKNGITNNMNILKGKGIDKLTTYSDNSDKSTEIKTDHTSINLTLHKLTKTNPKVSKDTHVGTTNLDNSKPSKTIKCWLCLNERRLMNCETFLSKSLLERKVFVVMKTYVLTVFQRNMF